MIAGTQNTNKISGHLVFLLHKQTNTGQCKNYKKLKKIHEMKQNEKTNKSLMSLHIVMIMSHHDSFQALLQLHLYFITPTKQMRDPIHYHYYYLPPYSLISSLFHSGSRTPPSPLASLGS